MATFPRGHHLYQLRVENAKKLAHQGRLVHVHIDAAVSARFEFPDPVDLRGIPAVGRGVGGHIRGTQPEAATTR
jgi:hypothetical protein